MSAPVPDELAPSVVGGKVSHAHYIRHAGLGVATVAELRAALAAGTLTTGDVVHVGCHTVAGWGGGRYRVLAKGSYVDNDGTVLTGGTLAALFLDAPSVDTFGAVGDGLADSAAAINAALAALLPEDSGWFGSRRPSVRLNAGAYLVSTTISPPAHSGFFDLVGEGRHATSINWGGTAGLPVLLFLNASRVHVKDLRIVGSPGAKPSAAIEFRRVAGYTGTVGVGHNEVRRVDISSESAHVTDGIIFTCESAATDLNNDVSTVSGCEVTNYTGVGIGFRHLNCLLNFVSDCRLTGCGLSAIALDTLGDANSSVSHAGGSYTAVSCRSSGNAYTYRFGAGAPHKITIVGWASEGDSDYCTTPYAPVSPYHNDVVDYGSLQYIMNVTVGGRDIIQWYGVKQVGGAESVLTVAAGGVFRMTGCYTVFPSYVVDGTLSLVAHHEDAGWPAFTGAGDVFVSDDSMREAQEFGGTFADASIGMKALALKTPGVLYFTPTAPSSLKYMTDACHDNQRITIVARNGNLTLVHGTAAAQLRLSTGADTVLPAYGSVTLQHSHFDDHWYEVARSF